jgi:hypothetical protein
MQAAEARPSFPVQVADFPGVLIELPTRFGEGNPAGSSVEQRNAKLFFEDGHSLAHRGLTDA